MKTKDEMLDLIMITRDNLWLVAKGEAKVEKDNYGTTTTHPSVIVIDTLKMLDKFLQEYEQ